MSLSNAFASAFKELELIPQFRAARAEVTADGFQAQIAEASRDTAQAKRETEQLHREEEALKKQAEDERLARMEIENRVAWRRITPQQQADMGLHLSKLPPQRVSMWYEGPDMESQTFASDIALALRATRTWVVGPPGGMITMSEGGSFTGPITGIVTGVTVVSTSDGGSRVAAAAIAKELSNLGFDAVLSPKVETGKFAQIWVNVNHRPEGPQGDAKLRGNGAAKSTARPVRRP